MARTRAEIRALVQYNTGRSDKTTLINSLCDSALKYAIMEHDFDAVVQPITSDLTITAGATSSSLSTVTPSVFKLISATIIRTDGLDSVPLAIKGRVWWGQFVPNVSDVDRGVPTAAYLNDGILYYNCPVDSDCKLRISYSTIPTFTADNTACPIEILDLFVEYYVTAHVFLSVEAMDKFTFWNIKAVGNNPERPGGELARAIRTDERMAAKLHRMEPRTGIDTGSITVRDLDWTEASEHSEYRRFS